MAKLLAATTAALWIASAAGAAAAQAPEAGVVISRLNMAYRGADTLRLVGTVTRKVGTKEVAGTVTVAVRRPNLYLLEVKGEKLETLVVSDGTDVVAMRPDRKVYTRARAPRALLTANTLAKVEVPTPGARIVTLLLEGRLRTPGDPLAAALAAAKVTATAHKGRPAYRLSFDYGEGFPARVTVSADDNLIRRVEVLKEGQSVVTEAYETVEINKPLPADTFVRPVPAGALLATTLPPLDVMHVVTGPTAPGFTLKTVDGKDVTLASLRGKVVLLNFFFDT